MHTEPHPQYTYPPRRERVTLCSIFAICCSDDCDCRLVMIPTLETTNLEGLLCTFSIVSTKHMSKLMYCRTFCDYLTSEHLNGFSFSASGGICVIHRVWMHLSVICYWFMSAVLHILLDLKSSSQTVLLANYPACHLRALPPRTACLVRTLPLCNVKSKKRLIIHDYLLYNI